MDSKPLVSIICLCHNQKSYVRVAIESVLTQTYPHIELIIVDDASTDGSQEEITHLISEHPDISFISLKENMGNCKAFNIGFHQSKGEFIIDLAADDVLLPHRVEIGIEDFRQAGKRAGVHFSDALLIDKSGKTLSTHYQRDPDGQLIEQVPEGDVYEPLIHRYFICPPTMMIKREVLSLLGGYDEQLSYEDFDFWIRSSREYQYLFNKAPLVKKRILKGSLSSGQHQFRNRHQFSTYLVCEKILQLNRNPQENQALLQRCNYEIKQCFLTGNLELIPVFWKLKRKAKHSI